MHSGWYPKQKCIIGIDISPEKIVSVQDGCPLLQRLSAPQQEGAQEQVSRKHILLIIYYLKLVRECETTVGRISRSLDALLILVDSGGLAREPASAFFHAVFFFLTAHDPNVCYSCTHYYVRCCCCCMGASRHHQQ